MLVSVFPGSKVVQVQLKLISEIQQLIELLDEVEKTNMDKRGQREPIASYRVSLR